VTGSLKFNYDYENVTCSSLISGNLSKTFTLNRHALSYLGVFYRWGGVRVGMKGQAILQPEGRGTSLLQYTFKTK